MAGVMRAKPRAVPNKPMSPTAPASPVANPSRPLRRHIGQPLGRLEGSELSSMIETEALLWEPVQ